MLFRGVFRVCSPSWAGPVPWLVPCRSLATPVPALALGACSFNSASSRSSISRRFFFASERLVAFVVARMG